MNPFAIKRSSEQPDPMRRVGESHCGAGNNGANLWQHARVWWARMLRFRLRQPRHLRLCESLPLGERRFVAVVEFEHSRFLLGGTAASLVLLARLGKAPGEVQEETQSENDTQSPDRPARISGSRTIGPTQAIAGDVGLWRPVERNSLGQGNARDTLPDSTGTRPPGPAVRFRGTSSYC